MRRSARPIWRLLKRKRKASEFLRDVCCLARGDYLGVRSIYSGSAIQGATVIDKVIPVTGCWDCPFHGPIEHVGYEPVNGCLVLRSVCELTTMSCPAWCPLKEGSILTELAGEILFSAEGN